MLYKKGLVEKVRYYPIYVSFNNYTNLYSNEKSMESTVILRILFKLLIKNTMIKELFPSFIQAFRDIANTFSFHQITEFFHYRLSTLFPNETIKLVLIVDELSKINDETSYDNIITLYNSCKYTKILLLTGFDKVNSNLIMSDRTGATKEVHWLDLKPLEYNKLDFQKIIEISPKDLFYPLDNNKLKLLFAMGSGWPRSVELLIKVFCEWKLNKREEMIMDDYFDRLNDSFLSKKLKNLKVEDWKIMLTLAFACSKDKFMINEESNENTINNKIYSMFGQSIIKGNIVSIEENWYCQYIIVPLFNFMFLNKPENKNKIFNKDYEYTEDPEYRIVYLAFDKLNNSLLAHISLMNNINYLKKFERFFFHWLFLKIQVCLMWGKSIKLFRNNSQDNFAEICSSVFNFNYASFKVKEVSLFILI